MTRRVPEGTITEEDRGWALTAHPDDLWVTVIGPNHEIAHMDYTGDVDTSETPVPLWVIRHMIEVWEDIVSKFDARNGKSPRPAPGSWLRVIK